MQFYWKCEECDETNAYPTVKFCETCGSPMTPAAEQLVLREQKEEAKRQAQIKKEKEQKRIEEQRAKQKAERKRQEALRAAERAEQERKKREQLEQALKRKEARETKFASILRKCTRFSSGFMRTFAVIVVIATIVLFIQNAERVNIGRAFQGVSDNIHSEYIAHTIVKEESSLQEKPEDSDIPQQSTDSNDEERTSRVLNKITTQVPLAFNQVFSNIGNQVDYLKSTYKPAQNISEIVEDIVEFFSGGVKE